MWWKIAESITRREYVRQRMPKAKADDSKKFMKHTRLTYSLVSALNVLPMRWNAEKEVFEVLPKIFSWQYILFIVSFLAMVIDIGFIIFRLFQTTILNWPIKENKDAFRTVLSLLSQLSTRAVALASSITALPPRPQAFYINHILAIRRAGIRVLWRIL